MVVNAGVALLTCVMVAVGCGKSPAPPPAQKPMPMPTSEPTKFELVEGKDVDVGGGVTVRLKDVMYSHLADSKGDSMLRMDVMRSGTQEAKTLNRLHPGEPKYVPVMGLEMAVDYVDAYHQPSTAAILVKRP